MKALLIVVLFAIFIGLKSDRIHWREITILGLFIGGLVSWQTFNIVFRYIGVE